MYISCLCGFVLKFRFVLNACTWVEPEQGQEGSLTDHLAARMLDLLEFFFLFWTLSCSR
ncbi:hypothetical protein Hanom_Chr11g00978091 [Helianthus anomalus]